MRGVYSAGGSLLISFAATGALAAPVVLTLGADLYQGPPHFKVFADTKILGEGDVAKTSGQVFEYGAPEDAKTLSIEFTNDAAAPAPRKAGEDRNLIVESAKVGNELHAGAEFSPVGDLATGQRESGLVLFSNGTVIMTLVAKVAEPPKPTCTASADVAGFKNAEASLTDVQQAALGEVVAAARSGCALSVTGYSSTIGTAAGNLWASMARAQAVVTYLQSQGISIPAGNIKGAGATSQFGPNAADNRRVVVSALSP